jgi:hypothetical protein
MRLLHVLAFVDYPFAEGLSFASEHVLEPKVHERLKFTRQVSTVHIEQAFFAQVCGALSLNCP